MDALRNQRDEQTGWIDDFLARHLAESGGNYVDEAVALRPELASMRMYERALVGVARADDPCFDTLSADGVIGAHFMPPRSWLPEARSVVSVFLTFTRQVNASNAALAEWPSDEWLHARIEGQTYINSLMHDLAEELVRRGYPSVAPSLDPRFSSVTRSQGDGRFANKSFTSVWSERHVAYACGLGTFGLAKGIITEAGAAGRLGSVVTTLPSLPAAPSSVMIPLARPKVPRPQA